ncbi:hypothetical protein ANN_19008 [Periplaneta americana]|uniref:Uncharacterized protein n=1 Tax=Periplaneta americana TaxID=6978 RepID=A0ABQ8SQB4_PERAM|nr:hypothetical protein ANN_19008 [Periplaneta americana]
MVKVCQRKKERKIMQVTLKDRIRNVDLRKNTGMKDAVQVADELKWKWGGHVARMRSESGMQEDREPDERIHSHRERGSSERSLQEADQRGKNCGRKRQSVKSEMCSKVPAAMRMNCNSEMMQSARQNHYIKERTGDSTKTLALAQQKDAVCVSTQPLGGLGLRYFSTCLGVCGGFSNYKANIRTDSSQFTARLSWLVLLAQSLAFTESRTPDLQRRSAELRTQVPQLRSTALELRASGSTVTDTIQVALWSRSWLHCYTRLSRLLSKSASNNNGLLTDSHLRLFHSFWRVRGRSTDV